MDDSHISCQCGKVCVCISNPTPNFRLECGCCDCRQALQWAEVQGGPPAPLLPDLWYFSDDFKFVSGQELTKWFKLRDNGLSIRCVATCCYSTILVYNPYYQNNVFMVMADAVKLKVPITEKAIRIQMKDIPKQKIGLLEPFPGRELVDPENLDETGRFDTQEEAFAFMGSIWSKKVEDPRGVNTQELIDNSKVEVLGLTHYQELI